MRSARPPPAGCHHPHQTRYCRYAAGSATFRRPGQPAFPDSSGWCWSRRPLAARPGRRCTFPAGQSRWCSHPPPRRWPARRPRLRPARGLRWRSRCRQSSTRRSEGCPTGGCSGGSGRRWAGSTRRAGACCCPCRPARCGSQGRTPARWSCSSRIPCRRRSAFQRSCQSRMRCPAPASATAFRRHKAAHGLLGVLPFDGCSGNPFGQDPGGRVAAQDQIRVLVLVCAGADPHGNPGALIAADQPPALL